MLLQSYESAATASLKFHLISNLKQPSNAVRDTGQHEDTQSHSDYRLTRFRNSSLVLAVERIQPNIQLVTVVELVFWTPRMTMQR